MLIEPLPIALSGLVGGGGCGGCAAVGRDHLRLPGRLQARHLRSSSIRDEALGILRGLVDRIELAPVVQDGRKTLSITLHGALAGIVGSPQNAKGPLGESDPVVECTKLVAGACNTLCLLTFAKRLIGRR